jgi:hypothetical protein
MCITIVWRAVDFKVGASAASVPRGSESAANIMCAHVLKRGQGPGLDQWIGEGRRGALYWLSLVIQTTLLIIIARQ